MWQKFPRSLLTSFFQEAPPNEILAKRNRLFLLVFVKPCEIRYVIVSRWVALSDCGKQGRDHDFFLARYSFSVCARTNSEGITSEGVLISWVFLLIVS